MTGDTTEQVYRIEELPLLVVITQEVIRQGVRSCSVRQLNAVSGAVHRLAEVFAEGAEEREQRVMAVLNDVRLHADSIPSKPEGEIRASIVRDEGGVDFVHLTKGSQSMDIPASFLRDILNGKLEDLPHGFPFNLLPNTCAPTSKPLKGEHYVVLSDDNDRFAQNVETALATVLEQGYIIDSITLGERQKSQLDAVGVRVVWRYPITVSSKEEAYIVSTLHSPKGEGA